MSPLAALSNITITVLGSAVILLNFFFADLHVKCVATLVCSRGAK